LGPAQILEDQFVYLLSVVESTDSNHTHTAFPMVASKVQENPGPLASKRLLAGPFETTLRDCEFFLTTIISKLPWNYDSLTFAVSWRKPKLPGKNLVVGGLVEDPVHPLHPPAARALATAVKALEMNPMKSFI
jgi:hypothetical protein